MLQHLPLADHPAASQLFPSDVISRAKAIAAATPGGVGAYSASQGGCSTSPPVNAVGVRPPPHRGHVWCRVGIRARACGGIHHRARRLPCQRWRYLPHCRRESGCADDAACAYPGCHRRNYGADPSGSPHALPRICIERCAQATSSLHLCWVAWCSTLCTLAPSPCTVGVWCDTSCRKGPSGA